MKKNSLLLFAALLVVVIFSSCGLFSKGCGCPTFGRIKQHSKIYGTNTYIAAAPKVSHEKVF